MPVALLVQKPDLDEGPEAAFSEVGSALGLLLVASLCAFALMNIGPVLVKLLADPTRRPRPRAGSSTASSIARIPLFLFQAVQASLLPKLSALAHSGHLGDFRVGLKRLLVAVAGLAAARHVGRRRARARSSSRSCSPSADLGSRTMGLLAAGAGLYMLAMACAQAVIALGRSRRPGGRLGVGPRGPVRHGDRWREPTTCSSGSSSGCWSAARWRSW